jgi:hypothetical protein
MRLRWMIVPLALAFSPLHAEGPDDFPGVRTSHGHSYYLVPGRAVEKGAVYELRLRIRWDRVRDYLEEYARWYFPVDQHVCPKNDRGCESSGRKLLSALSREHGDQYNLVLVYSYESAFKQAYYCKYRKAFFNHHQQADRPEYHEFVGKYYRHALKEVAAEDVDRLTVEELRPRLDKTLKALKYPCAYTPKEIADQARAIDRKPPIEVEIELPDRDPSTRLELELADETIHQIDLHLAEMVDQDEGSWNFDVSLCKIAELRKSREENKTVTAEQLEERCPRPKRSLLQQAIGEPK